MPRLISRTKFVPGGFKWLERATGFQIRPWSSFDSAVQQIIGHRLGNPALAARYSWATDYGAVAEELDAFNAQICAQLGQTAFISSDGPITPTIPTPTNEPQKATKCCGG